MSKIICKREEYILSLESENLKKKNIFIKTLIHCRNCPQHQALSNLKIYLRILE